MLRTCLVLRGVIVLATSAFGYHLGGPLRSSKLNGWFRTARPLFSATASSALGESCLDYAGLLRRICEGLQPAVLQAKYDKFHPNVLIMNDPAHTMQHPYLSMNITEKADLVLADKKAPSCRTKPLFAVVTGMGRGKTRFCVELDWELKRRSNVVSIPITFNCFWSRFDTTFENRRIDYAVNTVSRMLSIHYGIRFPEALMLIKDVLLPMKSQVIRLAPLFPEAFIRAAVRHIVEQMSAAGRQVEHFVLIVDESKRAEEMLGEDAHDRLRSALLNTPIDYLDLQQQAIPNVHLVMTSLDLKATGVRYSGRKIKAISLPASLDAAEVFDRWVQRYAPEVSKLSEGAKRRIRFLIVMFATTPRAVEVLCGYLSDRYYGPNRTTNGTAELDTASFAQLFRDVQEALSERYDDVNFVMTAKAFRGLLFNKDVQVDDTFLLGISDSVWTNAFAIISPNVNVVPQTSIGVAYRQAVLPNKARQYPYMLPVAGTVDSLLAHLNTPASGSEYVGNTLEIISKALISCRVAVNGAAGESFCLYELLGFDSKLSISERCGPKLLLRLESPIISSFIVGYVKPVLALSACNSYGKTKASNSKRAFLDKANNIIIDHESSAECGLHIELHKQECADGCWLLPTGRNPEDVIALFIDCKSGANPNDEADANADAVTSSWTKRYGWGDLPSREGEEPGRGARHLLKLADLATERNASSVHPGSLLDTLRRGRFVYVYLRAQEGQTTFGIGDHVLQVGCSDMQTFLSFFLDLHKLVRTIR